MASALGLQVLGEAPADLVEEEADQRLGAVMSEGGTTR